MYCGKLFAELWSSHSEGFPLPEGCFYSQRYKDQHEGNVIENFYREFYIVFAPQNGLREGTDYQIVMNAEIKDVLANENLIDLYAMCTGETGCERPFMVFEKGTAR